MRVCYNFYLGVWWFLFWLCGYYMLRVCVNFSLGICQFYFGVAISIECLVVPTWKYGSSTEVVAVSMWVCGSFYLYVLYVWYFPCEFTKVSIWCVTVFTWLGDGFHLCVWHFHFFCVEFSYWLPSVWAYCLCLRVWQSFYCVTVYNWETGRGCF
jgi:hypothetical protein